MKNKYKNNETFQQLVNTFTFMSFVALKQTHGQNIYRMDAHSSDKSSQEVPRLNCE